MFNTTWKELIEKEMSRYGETMVDTVDSTFAGNEIETTFDAGFGGSEGIPFTLWTENRVYFPVVYDGAEWVGSASRNPDGVPTKHFGGE